ncbi:MAG: (2Fe-2S)-binding protein [Bacteroidales bacterium]|nr:(2Fe-2S)-binding protein [Bacteroidales bacterium]
MMKISIDNKSVEVSRQMTVLEAADQNGIYIPRLCAHPELIPYGGCRLCIVEIEGIKGYPTACTAMVEDGMIIRTNTNMLQQMRRDLLQLILSEHPAACLLCDNIEGCSMFQETIRKVGVTTGCRWCPKDKDCELQRIVESFDVHELSLPGLYRDLPVEKYDPFFDRDYNLCIYCGRCVRICNEYRKSSVIAFRQRGKFTTIGPSFDENHIDAGCEFCGACVSVCPTGAMSEKSRKWWGLPDTYTKSVCPLCSINCDIQVLSLRDKIVGTLPPGKPHEAAGELCVKGRFCLSEMVNRTKRILEPSYLFPEGEGIIGWKEAFKRGAELIKDAGKGKTALYISPYLSMEEYSAIAYFARSVLKSSFVTSSCLDYNNTEYLRLSLRSIPLDKVRKSTSIISLFLNGNYNYAPLTMAVKNAASSGIPYYQIGWIRDSTSRFATNSIVPEPGDQVRILDDLIESIKGKSTHDPVIHQLAEHLKNEENALIVIGPSLISLSGMQQVLDRINVIIDLTRSKIYAPNPYGNIKGMLSANEMKPVEIITEKVEKGDIALVYLIGDMPFSERSTDYKLIYQSAFPAPENLRPDLVLPSAVWGEFQGTWPGMKGSTARARKAAKPHDYAKLNIDIINSMSAYAGKKGVLESMSKKNRKITGKFIPHLPVRESALENEEKLNGMEKLPFILISERSPHTYMNLQLDRAVEGLNELISPCYLLINHSDARKLGISGGEYVTIADSEYELTRPVKIRKNIPAGVIYITDNKSVIGFKSNPCYVNLSREHV